MGAGFHTGAGRRTRRGAACCARRGRTKVRPYGEQAFTLIEVLLAFALLSTLLLALNLFIFSMAEVWGRNRDQRLFAEHARAVTRYVGDLLRRAARPPAAADALHAGEVRTNGGAVTPLLLFELPEGDRHLAWPDRPLPDVQCAFDVRGGEGLVLNWHSRHELRFDEQPPRHTVVSPFVTRLDYEYYDEAFRAWQAQPTLRRDREGGWLVPRRLRLHFQRGAQAMETVVTVPAPASAPPVF